MAAAQVLSGISRKGHRLYTMVQNWSFYYAKRINKAGSEVLQRIRSKRKHNSGVDANCFTSWEGMKKRKDTWFEENPEWKPTPFCDNDCMVHD